MERQQQRVPAVTDRLAIRAAQALDPQAVGKEQRQRPERERLVPKQTPAESGLGLRRPRCERQDRIDPHVGIARFVLAARVVGCMADAPRLEADAVQHREGQLTRGRVGPAGSRHRAMPRIVGDEAQLDAHEPRRGRRQDHHDRRGMDPCQVDQQHEERAEQQRPDHVAAGQTIEELRGAHPRAQLGQQLGRSVGRENSCSHPNESVPVSKYSFG